MRQYEVCEFIFQGKEPEGSYVQIDMTAVFTTQGEEVKVKGFYAGDGAYKVRFMPRYAGTYDYKISGVVEETGQVVIKPAQLQQHGRVVASDDHFTYEDGEVYYPFGTTIYAFSHQTEGLTETTFQSLKSSPFNKVRMCVFPKNYRYNQNEPEHYAFHKDDAGNWDVHHPCMEFWTHLEEMIARLDHMGIQSDLILFHPYDRWGFSSLSQQDNLVYLDYLLRRLSAFPNIWWSLANEYDLCMGTKSIEDWEEIEEYVAVNDPHCHLLSNHNCFKTWDYERKNISHVSIQTKVLTEVPFLRVKYKKPVVVDECCYEGNLPEFWGSISGKEMTARFWRVFTSGGFCTHGETFLDPKEDIVWWAKGGVLQGESPARIQYLKDLIYRLPGALAPFNGKIEAIFTATEEELGSIKAQAPKEFVNFINAISRMDHFEKTTFVAAEHCWQGHYKDEAFLYYYDLRCCGRDTIELPEEHSYRVELIDTWNMTKSTLLENASGKTELSLPGKEGMAVLATRI